MFRWQSHARMHVQQVRTRARKKFHHAGWLLHISSASITRAHQACVACTRLLLQPSDKASCPERAQLEKKVVKLSSSPAAPVVSAHGIDNSTEALLDRTQRFVAGGTTVSLKGAGAGPANVFKPKTQLGLGGAKAGTIKGYSTDLERPYLRLHFAPDPATIRPREVLERALALVKKKWVNQVPPSPPASRLGPPCEGASGDLRGCERHVWFRRHPGPQPTRELKSLSLR